MDNETGLTLDTKDGRELISQTAQVLNGSIIALGENGVPHREAIGMIMSMATKYNKLRKVREDENE